MPKPYQPNDALARRAREEGFRARSIYKLRELNERYYLIRKNMTVLDVGAFPGSWLQYVSSEIGPKGKALGIDLKQIVKVADNVQTIVGDITDIPDIEEKIQRLGFSTFDLVIADMAPNTTGIKYHDQAASIELNQALLEIARKYLSENGRLISKVFQSELVNPFLKELLKYFKRAEVTTVAGSRDRSTEMYIVATGKL